MKPLLYSLAIEEAGFTLRQPGCSACLGMNEDKIPAGKYCISTSNRNFEGRQGPGGRTHLVSPSMAAAAAVMVVASYVVVGVAARTLGRQHAERIAMATARPAHVLAAYGAMPGQASLANNCLLARRLLEQGVRFVHLFDWGWDFHGTGPQEDIRDGLTKKAATFDKPAAALVEDLARRGMLDDTLVVFGTEFGRTPGALNGNQGRHHYNPAYLSLFAGGGVKGGTVYGATDAISLKAVEKPYHLRDIHTTMLHLLGFEQNELTYPHLGRDERLTLVEGKIIREIL